MVKNSVCTDLMKTPPSPSYSVRYLTASHSLLFLTTVNWVPRNLVFFLPDQAVEVGILKVLGTCWPPWPTSTKMWSYHCDLPVISPNIQNTITDFYHVMCQELFLQGCEVIELIGLQPNRPTIIIVSHEIEMLILLTADAASWLNETSIIIGRSNALSAMLSYNLLPWNHWFGHREITEFYNIFYSLKQTNILLLSQFI